MEEENEYSLSFLDVRVHRTVGGFSTSIYRKPTTTMLGTNFFSFLPLSAKLSGLSCRIFRAYKLSTSWVNFHKEVQFLTQFAKFNLFPDQLFYRLVNRFLEDLFRPKQPDVDSSLQVVYLKVPYFGPNTPKLVKNIQISISKVFPSYKIIFILVNDFKMNSFFRMKDILPAHLRSSVIYSYSCADCQARYVGQTGLQLQLRISKHLGLSYRTNRPLTSPENSAIRTHSSESRHDASKDSFKV